LLGSEVGLLVDRVDQELGKFSPREFQDNIAVFEQKVEPEDWCATQSRHKHSPWR